MLGGRGEDPGALGDPRGEAELQAVQVKLRFPGGVHRKEGASLNGVTTWTFFFKVYFKWANAFEFHLA